MGLIKKPTQCQRLLNALRQIKGGWINGRYFKDQLMMSQYHARIWELEKEGYVIEHSKTRDEFGFHSYRLMGEPEVQKEGLEDLGPNQIIQQLPTQTGVRRLEVKSNSNPDKSYIVAILPSGDMECDCIAFRYKRYCRHIDQIKLKI